MSDNNEIKLKFISRYECEYIFEENLAAAISHTREAFIDYSNGHVVLPDKISQVFDKTWHNRINILPASLLNEHISGLKWVSVFPSNSKNNLINLTGIIILSSTQTGYPLAIIDGTFITALRTAAVGALAADLLSRKNSKIIGLIGSGEQAKMHFRLINEVRNIEKCFVASRSLSSEIEFINQLAKEYPHIEFIKCSGNFSLAAAQADIIVTAISSQEPVLKAESIKKGATYIHVGGWEDEYEVALKANKIVCDDWENVKGRTQTISKMYKEGLLNDHDIYANLDEIVNGSKKGRETEDEFIYFNSVGLAFLDISFANTIYKECIRQNMGKTITLQE